MYRIQLQHKDFMVINKGPGLGMHDEGGEPGSSIGCVPRPG